MNLLILTINSFLIALSGAVSPGPLLAVTIDHSLKKGFKAGPLLISGHAILEFCLVLLVVKGLGSMLKRHEVFVVLSVLGGILLVWMGQDMFRKARTANIPDGGSANSKGSSVLSGILVSLSNPYWSIWWVTIGLTYLAYALPYGMIGIVCFFIGHISADFLWYSVVSFSLSKGRNRISPRTYRVVLGVCGLFLLLFGLWLMARLVFPAQHE